MISFFILFDIFLWFCLRCCNLEANIHKLYENKAYFTQKSTKLAEINAFFVKLFVHLAENE